VGLTVKSEKTPVDILTIDNAEKVVARTNVPSVE
jgi:hypothetical protein